MIDLYNPFAKYNCPDEIMPGETTGGSGVEDLQEVEKK
jgi:hypothetical protein